MKIIFFGSSEYCLPILDSLLKNFQLLTVVTKQASAAQQFAKLHNIAVFTPKDKKGLLELKDQISSLEPDLAIVADYGLIIPEEIFEIPQCKTLNIHFSRLPALRGPSPVQFTILTGEKSAWITVIIMAKEMDMGDIIWQKEVPLDSGKSTNYPINKLSNQQIGETTGSLYKKLFNIIALELPDIVNKYIKGEIKPQKQDHSKATYTKILTREDGY
ncbi:methionyl-tRNA formyltransferase, partial [Candidatus Gottesmanbacteria bacterium]|nr:methionyl-tRNA formyltransferase [Candidatus Gottesmanbacteria bacterium]